jgi:hypothetical protein
MLRKFVFAVLAVGVVTVGLLAEEYSGKVKSVDVDKNKIVISVKDGGDKEFTIEKDTKFTKTKGKDKTVVDVPEGLKHDAFKADAPNPAFVTVVTEKKGDKEVVTEVKMKGGRGGKKGKDK